MKLRFSARFFENTIFFKGFLIKLEFSSQFFKESQNNLTFFLKFFKMLIANPVGINIPHKCGMVSSTHMWRNIENQTGRVGIRTNVLWWQVWVAGGVTTELSIPRIKNDKFNFFLEIFLKCWCANPVGIRISHKCEMVSSTHLRRNTDTKQAEPGFEPTSMVMVASLSCGDVTTELFHSTY